jgi:hypothetical protein
LEEGSNRAKDKVMIYRRRRGRERSLAGYYHFMGQNQQSFHGYGDGDVVRIRDEKGNDWTGQAERMGDGSVRYRFRDSKGNSISGIADSMGILLRDTRGNTWRGYIY